MEIKDMDFLQRIMLARIELKAPKGQYSDYGQYAYRSLDDIMEAVKPVNLKYFLHLELHDAIELIGERFYVKATAQLYDMQDEEHLKMIQAVGYAREAQQKPKMDESQTTGSASSYARKYALNALYLIDDNKDADTDEYKREIEQGQQDLQQEAKEEIAGYKQFLIDNGEDIVALEQWICENEGVNRIEQLSFDKVYGQWKNLAAQKRIQIREQERQEIARQKSEYEQAVKAQQGAPDDAGAMNERRDMRGVNPENDPQPLDFDWG